jgi:site-specific DNA-cytosine methylase
MRLLELFSGTGSIVKAFGALGWEVVSLEIDPKAAATICEDIRTWDHSALPSGHFDVVWASPVCTHYSRARTKAKTPRDLVWADSLVLKALEVIEYFKPRCWFLENPQSGLLTTRPFMFEHPYTDVDYCRYSEWGYRKRIRIWNNCAFLGRTCLGAAACSSMEGQRHRASAQRGARKIEGSGIRNIIPNGSCIEFQTPCAPQWQCT